MKKQFLIISTFSMMIFLSSCGAKSEESTTLVFDNISIYAEGPLFEGSNTGQAEVISKLDSFLSANVLTLDQISGIEVTEMELKVADSLNFNAYKSIGIQLASNESAMQNVAILNPIDSGLNVINLKTATMQEDIKNIIKDKTFFVVADAIIKEDLEEDIAIQGKLTLKIKYSK